MSKKAADLNPGAPRGGTGFTTTRRGPVAARRAAASSRLAREARQQRIAYVALFGVIAAIIITLVVGALLQYVIGPAQPIATVNGVGIRTDTFNRYQKFQNYIIQNQTLQLQYEISRLQADTKHASANQAIISSLQQQLQQLQLNTSNMSAYTLQQMETALELQQAAAKIGQAATPAQIDAELATIKKQSGGASGFNRLLSSTGVQLSDLRSYYVTPIVVQQNVTKHYAATVPTTQPEAKARHILVASKALATNLATAIRNNNGATFAQLAKKYSTDNGLSASTPLTGTAKLQAEQQSSAWNGGWLRDPSQPFAANQPTWLTPQTGFVKPVLDAVLSMKPGEVRVVHSQFGYHVIQVTAHGTHKLTKAEIQQQADSDYQTWQTQATDSTKNKVNPSNPYTQFPNSTPTGG